MLSSSSGLQVLRPYHQRLPALSGWLNNEGRLFSMKNSAQSLALAAAFAGLLGGTSVRLNAQPVSTADNVTHLRRRRASSSSDRILRQLLSIPARARMTVKDRAVVSILARMTARARAAAPPMAPSHQRSLKPDRSGGLKASSLRIVMGYSL